MKKLLILLFITIVTSFSFAKETDITGYFNIPFGTEKNAAIQLMLENEGAELLESTAWPVPDAPGQTHVFFKIKKFMDYEIHYIVFIFEKDRFKIAYIMLKPKELEWVQYIKKEMGDLYGAPVIKEDDAHFWYFKSGYTSVEVLKFPEAGHMKDYVFITYKSTRK